MFEIFFTKSAGIKFYNSSFLDKKYKTAYLVYLLNVIKL